ncbi:unnamed protein product [Amoebophrya sp. A25]|nr:unnamed protein product [Amoebophrya sp. A25]|eukprot:GSA25T00021311001.1
MSNAATAARSSKGNRSKQTAGPRSKDTKTGTHLQKNPGAAAVVVPKQAPRDYAVVSAQWLSKIKNAAPSILEDQSGSRLKSIAVHHDALDRELLQETAGMPSQRRGKPSKSPTSPPQPRSGHSPTEWQRQGHGGQPHHGRGGQVGNMVGGHQSSHQYQVRVGAGGGDSAYSGAGGYGVHGQHDGGFNQQQPQGMAQQQQGAMGGKGSGMMLPPGQKQQQVPVHYGGGQQQQKQQGGQAQGYHGQSGIGQQAGGMGVLPPQQQQHHQYGGGPQRQEQYAPHQFEQYRPQKAYPPAHQYQPHQSYMPPVGIATGLPHNMDKKSPTSMAGQSVVYARGKRDPNASHPFSGGPNYPIVGNYPASSSSAVPPNYINQQPQQPGPNYCSHSSVQHQLPPSPGRDGPPAGPFPLYGAGEHQPHGYGSYHQGYNPGQTQFGGGHHEVAHNNPYQGQPQAQHQQPHQPYMTQPQDQPPLQLPGQQQQRVYRQGSASPRRRTGPDGVDLARPLRMDVSPRGGKGTRHEDEKRPSRIPQPRSVYKGAQHQAQDHQVGDLPGVQQNSVGQQGGGTFYNDREQMQLNMNANNVAGVPLPYNSYAPGAGGHGVGGGHGPGVPGGGGHGVGHGIGPGIAGPGGGGAPYQTQGPGIGGGGVSNTPMVTTAYSQHAGGGGPPGAHTPTHPGYINIAAGPSGRGGSKIFADPDAEEMARRKREEQARDLAEQVEQKRREREILRARQQEEDWREEERIQRECMEIRRKYEQEKGLPPPAEVVDVVADSSAHCYHAAASQSPGLSLSYEHDGPPPPVGGLPEQQHQHNPTSNTRADRVRRKLRKKRKELEELERLGEQNPTPEYLQELSEHCNNLKNQLDRLRQKALSETPGLDSEEENIANLVAEQDNAHQPRSHMETFGM